MSGLTARNGSSPHTRGTLIVCPRWCAAQRFIPAYAGNAPAVLTERGGPAVHPRIRGERSGFGSFSVAGNGSSPHTRGTHGYWFLHDAQTRFIPAYAGNASWRSCHPRRWPVHPRIRGERDIVRAHVNSANGSSPHTRGTPRPQMMQGTRRRFIPAYAGNASGTESGHVATSVHPRIRGERCCARSTERRLAGSSPHTRGTLLGVFRPLAGTRFIPAYAGNAAGLDASALTTYGSSPHTRGTP